MQFRKQRPTGFVLHLDDIDSAVAVNIVREMLDWCEPQIATAWVDAFSDVTAFPPDVSAAQQALRHLSLPGETIIRKRPLKPTYMGIRVDWRHDADKDAFKLFAPYAIYAKTEDANGATIATFHDSGTGVFVSNRGDVTMKPPPINLPSGVEFVVTSRVGDP